MPMNRLAHLVLLVFVAACAGRDTCPPLDQDRLAEAVAAEIARRVAASDEPADDAREMEDVHAEDEYGDLMRVPIDGHPSLGPSDARVTMAVFTDFECPFCSRAVPTIEELRRRHPDDLRVVVFNTPLPFHANARLAAEAALEAFAQRGDSGFFAMHDLLMANQRALTREDLERYASRLELDLVRFRSALDARIHSPTVDADLALAQRIGANGTPNFFLNGRQLVGAQPIDAFEVVFATARAEADALIARGVAADDVYATLMADASEALEAPSEPSPSEDPPPARRPGAPDPSATYRVELPARTPMRGPADALVTIVQFSDFECPFCSRVEPTLDALREQYGNDLRIVWLNNPLPFHRNARPAAFAAREAYEQGRDRLFWALHAKLFENQRELSRERIERLAQEVRMDLPRLRRALDSSTHEPRIAEEQALARRFGASGTPNFFINGRFLGGAQPIERFRELIDAELAEARALVASGVRRRDVYTRVIREGLTEVETAAPTTGSADAPDRVYELPVPLRPIAQGPEDAPITLQVFSDFQCPFCARLVPTLAAVRERYGDTVRIVWRDYPLPFHQDAMLAAEAAREVFAQRGQEAYFRYHAVLFANQSQLDRESLERYAAELGSLDMQAFRRALDIHKHRRAIQADLDAVRTAGIDSFGTPTTFVDGTILSGALPVEHFVERIDARLRARGLPTPRGAR